MADTTTTTNAAGSSNTLSVSLPTDFLSGAGNNGLNVNFNFGGNASAIANSAYNFLNTSFNNDKNFLGGAIVSTQNFVASQSAPALSAVYGLGQTFTKQMPFIINNLFGAAVNANTVSEQISANATAASEAASQASIAESNKASGGGGLCFITTAVCKTMNLPDDCDYLQILRAFRDNYMKTDHDRAVMVKVYYQVAPEFVALIDKKTHAASIYKRMLHHFIKPAVEAINQGDNVEAMALYCALVEYARVYAHE